MRARRSVSRVVVSLLLAGAAAAGLPLAGPAAANSLPAAPQSDFTGDHVADVLATAPDGSLYVYPGTGTGRLGTRRTVGNGWSAMDDVLLVGQFDGTGGTDLVARVKATGELRLYPRSTSGTFGVSRVIGTGWNSLSQVVAPGDWDGNGTPDLLGVRRSDGTLWLYPGTGRGTFGAARQIASGWGGRDLLVSAGDFDGDRATDLLSRDTATGNLWLNPGDGMGGLGPGRVVGNGWSGMTALVGTVDANGDGHGDLVARDSLGLLHLYLGNGTGGFAGVSTIGSGWDRMDVIASASVRADPTLRAYSATVAPIDSATASRMSYSYHAGCPVPLSALRLMHIVYYGFDRAAHVGELVVNQSATAAMTGAFRTAYAVRFPIRRMVLVDVYRADDDASMAADNTSAFNCRAVTGGTGWSAHSYGTAVDVDPLENPYVHGSIVAPPAGAAYLDRSNNRPGMLLHGDAVVRGFAAVGWSWGGDYTSLKDYQHFSASGG